jgi:hypothetical protein
MPYQDEYASKLGHIDFFGGEVERFMAACSVANKTPVSRDEFFHKHDSTDWAPSLVVGIDGSYFINTLPILRKTQTGHVKVSCVCVDAVKYAALQKRVFVDPDELAQAYSVESLVFSLPGPNMLYGGASSPRSSFRKAFWEVLLGATLFGKPMLDTFAAITPEVFISTCPSCYASYGERIPSTSEAPCPACGEVMYPTDSLRIHEAMLAQSDCGSAISQAMRFFEHLAMAHHVRMLVADEMDIDRTAYVMDGPLAFFGAASKMSSRFQKFYFELEKHPVIIGVQKTGTLATHAAEIADVIEDDTVCIVDTTYRKLFLENDNDDFGYETYYGQEFIGKVGGQEYVFMLPFDFLKKEARDGYREVVGIEHYEADIKRTLATFKIYAHARYKSAVWPVSLAHEAASISPAPAEAIFKKKTAELIDLA